MVWFELFGLESKFNNVMHARADEVIVLHQQSQLDECPLAKARIQVLINIDIYVYVCVYMYIFIFSLNNKLILLEVSKKLINALVFFTTDSLYLTSFSLPLLFCTHTHIYNTNNYRSAKQRSTS
jgi:hypothetical protein